MKPTTPLKAFFWLLLLMPSLGILLLFAGALALILWPFIALIGAAAMHSKRGLRMQSF